MASSQTEVNFMNSKRCHLLSKASVIKEGDEEVFVKLVLHAKGLISILCPKLDTTPAFEYVILDFRYCY